MGASTPAAAASGRSTLLAASACISIIQLDVYALNLALPTMASELDTSVTNLHWVISGFLLAEAAFLVPGGRLGDLVGRKRMLVAGLAVIGLGSLGAGLAPTAASLIAFRIVGGIGAGIVFPLAFAVITHAFPGGRAKRAIGSAYGVGAIALALGPLFGGGITELVSWRTVLLVDAALCVAATAVVATGLRESRDPTAPPAIDLPGLFTVVLAVAAVTLAVDRTNAGSPVATVGLVVVGLLAMAAFVLRERVARYPLVELDLFHNSRYVIMTLMGMVAHVAFTVAVFAATIYTQQVRGYSPFVAGMIVLALCVSGGIAGPIAGRLSERCDPPRAIALVTIVGAIGLLTASAGGHLAWYLLGLAVTGLGYRTAYAMTNLGTQAITRAERVGQASGVTQAALLGAAGIAVAATGSLIETGELQANLAQALSQALRWLAAGSVAAAALLAWRSGVTADTSADSAQARLRRRGTWAG
ncbi:MFS transporter [Micromonospora sp. WMMA1363]|uniref:MFS transporter n=1 Tax=Micromonospora sp. WMMA1363 TaxID=3053985 RepID=UPI00259C9665|nr:MFS transporter [Micromonospora sp. WMMA1363]MDM4718957.1 MFS transporter [Micromonospora sp. WMMA1363]